MDTGNASSNSAADASLPVKRCRSADGGRTNGFFRRFAVDDRLRFAIVGVSSMPTSSQGSSSTETFIRRDLPSGERGRFGEVAILVGDDLPCDAKTAAAADVSRLPLSIAIEREAVEEADDDDQPDVAAVVTPPRSI